MIDIALLASTIVAKYLVPYVGVAAKEVAEVAYEKVGKEAVTKFREVAGKVWDKVSATFNTPDDQAALKFFKDNPDGLKSTVEKILTEKLELNPQLAQELSGIVQSSEVQSTSTGAQIGEAINTAILDFRNANFQNSQNLRFVGLNVGSASNPSSARPKDEPAAKPTDESEGSS